jgi:MipA family protein
VLLCRLSRVFCLVCVAAAGLTFPAQAQTKSIKDPISYIIDQLYPPVPDFKTPSGYKVRIGAVAGFTPAFEGSSDYHFRYAPLLDVVYRDRIFLNSNRLRFNFLPAGNIRGGFQLKYRAGRKERLSEDLVGLGDIGASLEAGGYVEARFHATVFSFDVTRDIAHGHRGTLAGLLVGQGLYQDKNTVFGIGLHTHWASKAYMNTYFGVDAAQSIGSGLPIYTAGAGFKDVGLTFYLKRDLSKHISLVTNITLRHMLDSANDSPIVIQHGDPKQFLSSMALRYEF